ncbi:MAG: peptidylprolyl isomerase, partial [Duncaniella sp.]|nr:peptidylprolyl isomerase [Duncaniella sp.]
MKYLTSIILAIAAIIGAQAQTPTDMDNNTSNSADVKVLLKTTLGDITIELYGDTPRHRDNFVKLVKEGHYDGVLFHRVINDFMVQTGAPNSKDAPKGKMLGGGDVPY